MFSLLFAKKGISLTEVMIALFLISFGMLALVSLLPQSQRVTGRSDFLGRAAGILNEELESNEVSILNPCNPNPCSSVNPLVSTKNVCTSGQAASTPGDMAFTVQTTITDNGNNTWTVVVRVTWLGNNTGISESRFLTRQEHFRYPAGCV